MKRIANMEGDFGSGSVVEAMLDLREILAFSTFEEIRSCIIDLKPSDETFSSNQVLRPILRHLVWSYDHTKDGVHYWSVKDGLFERRDFQYLVSVLKQPEMYDMPFELNQYSWRHQYYLKALAGAREALKSGFYCDLTTYSSRTLKSFRKCIEEIEKELAKELDPSTLFESVLDYEQEVEQEEFDPKGTILEHFL